MWSVLFRDVCLIWENQFPVITGFTFVIAFIWMVATGRLNLEMLSLEFIVSTHRFKHAGDLKAFISISDGSSIRAYCHNKLNSSKTTKIKWLLRFQLSRDNVLSRSENTKENISCKQKHFSLKKYLGLSVKVQGGGTTAERSSCYTNYLMAPTYSAYTSSQ